MEKGKAEFKNLVLNEIKWSEWNLGGQGVVNVK